MDDGWLYFKILFYFRLTETNCVEIVNKLIELKLLDVVFTSDGKEYITPQQLNREIQDELYVNGGKLVIINS